MLGSRSKTKGSIPPLFGKQVNQNTMRFFEFLWSYLQHELVKQINIPRCTYCGVCEPHACLSQMLTHCQTAHFTTLNVHMGNRNTTWTRNSSMSPSSTGTVMLINSIIQTLFILGWVLVIADHFVKALYCQCSLSAWCTVEMLWCMAGDRNYQPKQSQKTKLH